MLWLLGCRDPVIAVGAFGGVALAGVALVDWHYALRYVGTLGTQLTLINWLTSYDSPQVYVCVLHQLICLALSVLFQHSQTANHVGYTVHLAVGIGFVKLAC